MTTSELNRDIKRLYKNLKAALNREDYYEVKKELEKEFLRLYNADREMKYMNAQSIKMMLSLNLSHRFVALHQFGIDIEI